MRGALAIAVAAVAVCSAGGTSLGARRRGLARRAFGIQNRGSEAYSFLLEKMVQHGGEAPGPLERSQAAFEPPALTMPSEADKAEESGGMAAEGAPESAQTKTMVFQGGTKVHVFAPHELDAVRMKMVADHVAEIAGNTTSNCFCKFAAAAGRDETTPFGNVDCLCAAQKTGAPVDNSPQPVPVDFYGERARDGENMTTRFRYAVRGDLSPAVEELLLSLDAGDRRSFDGKLPVWRDAAGSELSAKLDGHVVFQEGDGGSLRFGELGGDDRALVQGIDLSPQTHPALTIEVWVKLHSKPNKRGYLVGHDNGEGNLDRAIYMHDSRFAPAGAEGTTAIGAGQQYVSSLSAPSVDKWMQVVAVWHQSGPSFVYRNTVRSDGPPATFNRPGGATLSIGAHQFLPDQHVDASIACVRVYGRALTESEVQQNFDFLAPRFGL